MCVSWQPAALHHWQGIRTHVRGIRGHGVVSFAGQHGTSIPFVKKSARTFQKGITGEGASEEPPPPGMTQILAVKGTASRQLYLTFKMLTWKYLLFHKRLAPQAVGTQRKLRFGQLTLTRGGRHLKTGETGCTTRPSEPFPGFVECRVLSSPLMI